MDYSRRMRARMMRWRMLPAERLGPDGRLTVGLGLLCGAALWASLGVLDVAGPPNAPVRVAMLPSWWLLVALAVATTGALIGLVGLLTRSAARRGQALAPEDVVDALRPLAASGLLLLPYLPWLPDVLPVLLALTGTLRWLVWLVVVAQAARGVWCLVAVRREPPRRGPAARGARHRGLRLWLGRRGIPSGRHHPLPDRRRAALSDHGPEPVARR